MKVLCSIGLPRVVFLSVSVLRNPKFSDDRPPLSSPSEETAPAATSDRSGDKDEAMVTLKPPNSEVFVNYRAK